MKGLICALLLTSGFLFAQQNIAIIHSDLEVLASNDTPVSTLSISPFELVNGMIIVRASVDGIQGEFILDTGSPGIVMNTDEIKNASEYEATGIGGCIEVGEVKLQEFSWGIIQRKNINGFTLDISHLETACNRSLMGMIGFDLISQYEIFFDYQNHMIRIYDAKRAVEYRPPGAVKEIPFELNGHIPIINARIGNKNIHLGLDSGAESNILDKSFFEVFREEHLKEIDSEYVVGLERKLNRVKSASVSPISINSNQLPIMRFLFVNLSPVTEQFDHKLDGLLGFPFFQEQKISINYKKKTLYLW